MQEFLILLIIVFIIVRYIFPKIKDTFLLTIVVILISFILTLSIRFAFNIDLPFMPKEYFQIDDNIRYNEEIEYRPVNPEFFKYNN